MITSKSNPKIKRARALGQRKERESDGLFVAEGIALVGAALEAGATIEYVLYAPESLKSEFANDLIKRATKRKIEVEAVEAEVFASIAKKDNPVGLLAVVRQPGMSLGALATDKQRWYVALVAPQDPGNGGTILRTVDAVGASGLILLDGGVDVFHPTAVRASLGALFYKPIAKATFGEFSQWARELGYRVVGTSAKGSDDYLAATYAWPLILLMGNEQKGLSGEQRAACDQVIRMPMEGKVSSLNLAVATGVLLYALKSKMQS